MLASLGAIGGMSAPRACVAAEPDQLLYSFTDGADGATPGGALVADKAGNLYGTAFWGGNFSDASCGFGCGVVFKLSPPASGQTAWSETTIYQFPGGVIGALPAPSLVEDRSGNLYGSTSWGGTGTQCAGGTVTGCGTVFEVSPPGSAADAWTLKTLYGFQGGDDAYSGVALTLRKNGALLGVSAEGGAGCGIGCGTVFKLTPPQESGGTWTETVLYRFQGGSDGSFPVGNLVQDASRTIYGATSGISTTKSGGTVYALLPPAAGQTQWTEKVLHRFRFYPGYTGTGPSGGLIGDSAGNLIGTTVTGGVGCAVGCGTLFELSPPAPGTATWQESALYQFRNKGQGGAVYPIGGPIEGKNGTIYTATLRGGVSGNLACEQEVCGAVVKLIPPSSTQPLWTMRVLHGFAGPPTDAANPQASLLNDGDGNLYGTATPGGSSSEWGAAFAVKR